MSVLLSSLCAAGTAEAYCQTTTCTADDPTAADACEYQEDGCAINGIPLSWPQACVSFSVQKDGSPKLGITWETMQAIEQDVYYQWSNVDCVGGQIPSIQVWDRSPVNCNEVVYNRESDQPNANVWMFHDQIWGHEGSGTLALTTVTFSPKTGEIYDADVDINSAQNEITVGDTHVQFDLKSIVTHEAGHTLGLAHSSFASATMYAEYSPRDTQLRSLSEDDIAGICAVYPPGEDRGACDATPRHGFSTECRAEEEGGCALVAPIRPRSLGRWGGLGGLALGLAAALARRRGARPRCA